MPKPDEEAIKMPEQIRLLHDNYKPRWGPESSLMYSIPGKVGRYPRTQADGLEQPLKSVISSKGRDVCCVKVGAAAHVSTRVILVLHPILRYLRTLHHTQHMLMAMTTLQLTPESLQPQRANTKITVDSGVPMTQTQKTPFASFAAAVGPTSAYEETVWTLASILFDDQDSVAHGVPASQAAAFDYRIRKDRLIDFWSSLCLPAATKAVKGSKTQEERALHHLSAHQIVDACDVLVQGEDYHLAILISQIGDGDQVVRDDMESQINTWRDLNSLSEMTEPIRALYALTAGKTCTAEGKKGPPEDRAATFALSTRFSLDWKRAFGLRLYYAVLATEPIEVAIKAFAEDLRSDLEPAKPSRVSLEHDGTIRESEGEDLLWGLLQLYAASKDWLPFPSLASILAGQSMSARDSPNTLLSFQLYHALALRFPDAADAFVADSLAIDFAQQLECAGEWMWSLFATLHITNASQRQRAIQALLSFHVSEFGADDEDQCFQALVEDCKIPKAWIWRAKAQAARTVTQNHTEEAMYLIKAGELKEAHEVLLRIVGPRCVIAEEWTILSNLLEGFKEGKENIDNWALGGQVYEDYLTLIRNRVSGNAKVTILGRLMDNLPDLGKRNTTGRSSTGPRSQDNSLNNEGFEEMVALREISAKVAKEVMATDDGPWRKQAEMQRARVLHLPLAKEQCMKGTVELAERYYRGVLGGS